jgi:hypothetical protein
VAVLPIISLLNLENQLPSLNESLFLCKLYNYIFIICVYLSPYFIVLASIDRYCASSISAKFRKCSCPYVARRAIPCMIILIMIIFSSTPVINDIRPDGLGCYARIDSSYKQAYSIIQVIFFSIVAPTLMVIFGLMTIQNTKRLLVAPVAGLRQRRTEGQLARMLLLQVGAYVILCLPYCIIFLISILPVEARTTFAYSFAFYICQLLFDFSYATTFIVYILTGSIYKMELTKLFRKIFRINTDLRIHPEDNGSTTMQKSNY